MGKRGPKKNDHIHKQDVKVTLTLIFSKITNICSYDIKDTYIALFFFKETEV